MSWIKIILIVPLVVLLLYFITRLRSKVFYRLFVIAVAITGILFVLFPDFTNVLAHHLGVGRGTDLILYLAASIFFVVLVIIYSRIRKIEEQQTRIIRELALQNAERLN